MKAPEEPSRSWLRKPRPKRPLWTHRTFLQSLSSWRPSFTGDEPRETHPLSRRLKWQSGKAALLFLALAFALSLDHWQSKSTSLFSASQRQVFEYGEVYRLFTSILVHADIGHLLANAGLLFVFGTLLRHYYGIKAFPGLSLILGWLTACLALLTYPSDVTLVGASGMVYSMVGVWLFWFWQQASFLSRVQRSMRVIAFFLVVLIPTQWEPQVSYRSHALGFALGLFFAWLLGPWIKPLPLDDEEWLAAQEKLDLRLSKESSEQDLAENYEPEAPRPNGSEPRILH